MRKTGLDLLGDVSWGTHFCQFYKTKGDLLEILVPYFKAGLENNQFCMWITSEPLNKKEAEEAMKAAMPDFDKRMKAGQIEIRAYTDWYLKDGFFDEKKVLNGWVDKLNNALKKGYNGLRLTGNTFWLEKKDWKRFSDYEEEVNKVIGKYKIIAICTYSLEKCGASEVADVIASHQFAIMKREGKWDVIMSDNWKEAIEALKKSEERYKLAEYATGIGSWDWNILTGDLAWSDTIEQLFGFGEGKFGKTYKAFLECVHPDDRQRVIDAVNACVEKGADYHIEHRIIWPDSTVHWVLETGNVIRDINGKAVRMLGIVQDITERKLKDDKIEDLSRFPLENPWPVMRIADDCTISYANKASDAILSKWRRSVGERVPDDFGRIIKEVTVSREKKEVELEAEGRVFSFALVPISKQRYINLYGRDVTLNKKAEDAIKKEKEFSESILGTMPDGVDIVDENLGIVYMNKTLEDMFGKNNLGRKCYEVYRADKKQCENCPLKDPLNGNTKTLEVSGIGDGKTFLISHTGIKLNGKRRVLEIFSDITERKQADEQVTKLNEALKSRAAELEAANQELEAFSYSTSHDLRSPLRSIDGFSHALLEDYDDKLDDKGRDYLRRLRAATQRMGQLIDDLLKLSKVTQTELNRKEVDLSSVARAITTKLQEAEPERDVELAIAPGLVAKCDKQLITIAFENLIGNSWKFTSKQPSARIEFGTAAIEGKQAYFIRDNGAGFDMAYAAKLFMPFQRLHSATEFPGTGIGLAIVSRIIARHGGRIWAEGGIEKGATFHFTLQGGG